MRSLSRQRQHGGLSIQMLVLLVPTILLMMGFAIDLGRMYMIRAELKQATNAMALAAATRLTGNDTALDEAATATQRARAVLNGIGNRYNFGGSIIGDTDGFLTSAVESPAFFTTAAAAIGEGDNAGNSGDGGAGTSKYVRVQATAEAPLTFFALLSLGQERKTTIAALSVAGQSAPLCQGCGIETFAIAGIDASDTTHFGFQVGSRYTFACNCNGNPPPAPLPDSVSLLRYQVINRQNDDATVFTDPAQQIFRIGADGLPSDANAARSCLTIGAAEDVWVGTEPIACNQNRTPNLVQSMLCGVAARFDPTALPTVCEQITDIATISTLRPADTDLTDLSDYASYTGNGRRVITVAVVETLQNTGMTVLGFRQFLVDPLLNGTTINPADQAGRFPVIYMGNPVPLRQGRFDGNCGVTTGPGKVVLYR